MRDHQNRLAFKKIMLKTSRAVWTCAPGLNETYNKITTHKMYLTPNLIKFENYDPSCEYSIITPNNHDLISKSQRTSNFNVSCSGALTDCQKINENVCVIKSQNHGFRYLRPGKCQDNIQKGAMLAPSIANCMCRCESISRKFRVFLGAVFSDYNNSR